MPKGNRVNDNRKGKAPAKVTRFDDDHDESDTTPEPPAPEKRPRKETSRKRDARQNGEEEAEARQSKRQATEHRRQERVNDQEAALFVEQDEETSREAQLRGTSVIFISISIFLH